MIESSTTKEKILLAALDLFSEKGFDGSSIDMIATAAGIKGPSLYKHFKGKEEILNALIEMVDDYYAKNFNSAGQAKAEIASMEQLANMAIKKVDFTIFDPAIKKTRKFLAIEQFRNPRLAALANMHSIDALQNMFTGIFTELMEDNIMAKGDAALLALEFLSPVTLLIQKHDRSPEASKDIVQTIRKHIKYFCETHVQKRG